MSKLIKDMTEAELRAYIFEREADGGWEYMEGLINKNKKLQAEIEKLKGFVDRSKKQLEDERSRCQEDMGYDSCYDCTLPCKNYHLLEDIEAWKKGQL